MWTNWSGLKRLTGSLQLPQFWAYCWVHVKVPIPVGCFQKMAECNRGSKARPSYWCGLGSIASLGSEALHQPNKDSLKPVTAALQSQAFYPHSFFSLSCHLCKPCLTVWRPSKPTPNASPWSYQGIKSLSILTGKHPHRHDTSQWMNPRNMKM